MMVLSVKIKGIGRRRVQAGSEVKKVTAILHSWAGSL